MARCKPGDVVVIRYEGPQGGPGMREMLSPTGAIMGRGLGDEVALITDGRFSGGTTASSSATSPRKLQWAGRSACCATAIATHRCGETRDSRGAERRRVAPKTRGVEAAQAVCDHRRAREVRAPRRQRIDRRGHRPR